jgi:CRP/FNR family transcriptional regulator
MYMGSIENARPVEGVKTRRRSISSLDLIESLARLEFSYLFDYLTLKGISSKFTFKRYPHRSTIYKVGDERSHIFGLVQGYVKAMREDRHGTQALVDILAPGMIFGEDALYLTGPRDRAMQAHEDVTVVYTSKEDFQQMISEHPKLYDYVFRTIGERLKRTEDRVLNLSLEAVPGRLTRVLSEMAFRYGTVQENGSVVINLKLPHREIADLVGSTRESVTAHLNDLRRRALIDVNERHIVINDLTLLSEAAG